MSYDMALHYLTFFERTSLNFWEITQEMIRSQSWSYYNVAVVALIWIGIKLLEPRNAKSTEEKNQGGKLKDEAWTSAANQYQILVSRTLMPE